MTFNLDVFKDYDIRGHAGTDLTPELTKAIGKALADFLEPGIVAVGRDMRLDSSELAEALIQGLLEQGREVWDIGLIPTDMLYFAVGRYNLAGGAVITASHNPGMDDGIKVCREGARPVGLETGLQDMKFAVRDDNFKPSSAGGNVVRKDVYEDWGKHVLSFVDLKKLKPLRLAIDAGNGMGGQPIPHIEKSLPFDIKPLYFELDGSFPNHPADPHDLVNLQELIKTVVTEKMDAGIAFDGDGDRAFLIDEKGDPVSASAMMCILSKYLLKKHPDSTVVYNALLSRIVPEVISAAGGKPWRSRVGGIFIKHDMREKEAVLGGEHSGHFYFRDNYYCDSGLIAALVALEALSESGMKLSELAAPYKKYFDSIEINRRVSDIGDIISNIIKRYSDGQIDFLDGLTVFYPDWWFNIRKSHTEPVIRLNVEADTKAELDAKLYELLNLLRSSGDSA